MENNKENNMGGNMNMESNVEKKKNNSTVMIIMVILILVIIAIIVFKKVNPQIETEPISQSEKDLNQAVTSDTTASINSNLDSINVNDTSEADLQAVDKELGNL